MILGKLALSALALLLPKPGKRHTAFPFITLCLMAWLTLGLNSPIAHAQTYYQKTLYTFTGSSNFNGANPYGNLILVNGKLYGTTQKGGSTNVITDGTVYSINPDGTGHQTIHNFTGTNGDGYYPTAGLIDVNGTLFGTTKFGGAGNAGTVFAIKPDGTGYTILYSFTGTGHNADGANPIAGLANVNGILYGTTYGGGNSGFGTIFEINLDGTGYQVLHQFMASGDGYAPSSSLTYLNGILYGTTQGGGLGGGGYGVIFSINPVSKAETTLHIFGGWPSGDGAYPVSDFVNVNGILYGTTSEGGPRGGDGSPGNGFGTLFSYNPATNVETPLFVFNGHDGQFPTNGLTLVNNILYGSTSQGGPTGTGVLFSLDPATNTETQLLNFNTPPTGDLLNLNGTLYGVTAGGGSAGFGTVFSLPQILIVAHNDAGRTPYNTTLNISAPGVLTNDTVNGGGALTATLVSTTTHGTLSLNINGSFQYVPTTGFVGTDSFTYKASNSSGTSNIATCTITVQAVVPIARNDAGRTYYNTTLTIPAPGVLTNDYNGGSPTTAALVTSPAHGSITFNSDGSFTYFPAAGYVGTDSFSYQDTNAAGKSNIATCTLTIQPVRPVAYNDSAHAYYNMPLLIQAPGVLGNDFNGGASITAALVVTTTNGSLTLNSDGSYFYLPNVGFIGTDSFTYQDINAAGSSNIATVTITVQARTPYAYSDSYQVAHNTALTVNAPGVLGNDDDGGSSPMTATLVTGTTHGTVSLNSNGGFTYTPTAGYSGTDSFTYQVANAIGKGNTVTVTLNVN